MPRNEPVTPVAVVGEVAPVDPLAGNPLSQVSPRTRDEPAKDLGELHVERQRTVAHSKAIADLARRYPREPEDVQGPPDPGAEAETPQTTPEQDAGITVSGVAGDIARGVTEIPAQALGGALDAVQETADLLGEFNAFAEETLADVRESLGIPDLGPDDAAREENLVRAFVPDVAEAESVTGGIVRNIAKFITGFVGAGKIKAVQKLAEAGKAGKVAAPLVKGAIADLAVFDPQEDRLSDLIQSVPALENPVSEFLQAEPGDSAAAGRLKNAVEGLGLGAASDVTIRALSKGLNVMRAHRAAKAAAGADATEEAAVGQVVEMAQAQRNRIAELLGDPDAPVFEIKPVDVPEEEAAAALARAGGEAADDGVFINWARIDSPEDVKAVMQDMADAFQPGIEKARRGVQTFAQTKLNAEELSAWDVLASRKKGEPLNAEQSLVVRELWARSGSKLREVATQVRDDPSDLNKIAFRKMLAVHNAIQESVIAARTETARALSSWRIPAGDNVAFAGQMDKLRELIRLDGDSEELAKRLLMLDDAGMIREADAFVYGSALAKGQDAIVQAWYLSLLSSPHTHARNVLSNMSVVGMQMLERKAASLIGQAMGQRAIPKGETTAQMFGAIQGMRQAFRISAKGRQVFASAAARGLQRGGTGRELLKENVEEFGTFFRSAATGESGFGLGKVELPRLGAISPEKLGLDEGTWLGTFASYVDTATTMPGRALAAADEVFKTITYNMELNAQAFRKTQQELDAGFIQPGDVRDRMATILNNPDEAMRLAAKTNAEISTFTNEPLETRAWTTFRGLGNAPWGLGRIVLPFRRTPFNIATYAFQRTPLAPFVKQFRDDIFAGGARAQLAMSRFVVGNGILLTMADFAISGHITGEGPSDPRKRATMRRMGIQPSSIRLQFDDGTVRYFSYRGLEPISTSIGLAANIHEILAETDWEDDDADLELMVIIASMAIANQAISAQYMSGVSAIIEAMSDPQRYGESWWKRLAGAVVPAGVANVTRQIDPTMRVAIDMTDAIRARTPGLSKDLPPRRDVWGDPIIRASGLGGFYDALSPIYSRLEAAEPIDAELNRLELWIGKPNARPTFDGVKVNLRRRPELYSRYVELAGNDMTQTVDGTPIKARNFVSSGKGLKDELNLLVTGKHPFSQIYNLPSFDMSQDESRSLYIKSIVAAFQREARRKLLAESDELRAIVDGKKADEQGRIRLR